MRKLLLVYIVMSVIFYGQSAAQQSNLVSAGRFFPYYERAKPQVALVLSGGGSRGISQIGVLEALEKAHIPIDLIVGTSMGSIIGGLYASGYSAQQLDSIALSQNWNRLLALSDAVNRNELFLQQKQNEEQSFLVIRLNGITPVLPSAIANGQRLTTLLTELVLNAPYRVGRSFNDLRIPFRAVATDLVSGKRIVISSGDLAQAMRASSTVPVMFTPIRADSLQLVDGGLVSNIPVDVARKLGASIVIAVNATSPLRPENDIETPWDALDQATSIMMQLSDRLELERADVVITPNLHGHMASNFSDLDSLIYWGRIATEDKISEIDSIYQARASRLFTEEKGGRAATISDPTFPTQTAGITDTLPLYRGDSRLYVSQVSFNGTKALPDSILRIPFDSLVGHFTTPKKINEACEDLIWEYRDRGYGMARIESVAYDSATTTIKLNINEGEIKSIDLKGNTTARPFLIKREFPLDVDQVFKTRKAIEGINNVYSTNLFSQVLLSTNYDPSTSLTIDVTEKSSRLLRFGFRADNERNGQLYASLSDDDILGTGTRGGFSFAGGLRNRLGQVFLGTTRIVNTDLTYSLDAFTGFRDVNYYVGHLSQGNARLWTLSDSGEYRIIRSGYEFSIGTQLRRFGTVSATLGYGWDRIKPMSNFNSSMSDRVVNIKLGSYIDSRDKAAFANSGILSDVYFETALRGLNSQLSYSKIFFDYEAYQTAFSDFTLKQHYEFGFGNGSLPLTRQFSLGGQDLFFGLPLDGLVGRQIFLASVELRVKLPFRIFFDTYISGRFDIGDVWAQQQNIVLRTLKQGIGGSLGFATPIGPILFSAGKAFYPGKEKKIAGFSTPWEFYFRVGVEIPTVSSLE